MFYILPNLLRYIIRERGSMKQWILEAHSKLKSKNLNLTDIPE